MDEISVREIRRRLGLSQERFAQMLGVSVQTVRRWESGLTKPLPIISLRLKELEQRGQGPLMRGGPAMGKETIGKDGVINLDVGLGVGGLFKGVGNLLEVLSKMAEEGKEETSQTGTVEAMGGKVKGVYGFSVRVGLGGKPVVEQFGNIKDSASGAVVADAREPLVDVLDEKEHILVVAEMPGVEEKDIHTSVEGDILEIVAATGDRHYRKEVLLPSPVDAGNVTPSYRNGILEVRLKKTQAGTS